MHNTEGGRKLNQAMTQTGRAVGGALSHAKGALSNWWSTLTTVETSPRSADDDRPPGEEEPVPADLESQVNLEPPAELTPAAEPALLQSHASPARLAGIQSIECCPPKLSQPSTDPAAGTERGETVDIPGCGEQVNKKTSNDSDKEKKISSDVGLSADISSGLVQLETVCADIDTRSNDSEVVGSGDVDVDRGLRKPRVEIV